MLFAQTVPPPISYAVDAWTIADGLPQTDIRGLTLDRDGYLWLGTNLGLTRFDGRMFEHYPRSLASDVPSPVWDVVTGRDGTVRVLWPHLGVGRVHNDGRLERPSGLPLPDFRFHQFAFTGDTAWVTTGDGLRLFWSGVWSSLPELPDRSLGAFLTIAADRSGAVWIGGSKGLAKVSPQARERINRIRGLACPNVRDLSPAVGADLWVITCAGVEHVAADGKSVSLVVPRPLREQPYRIATTRDPDVLWLGDARGIHRLQVRKNADASWRVRITYEDDLDLGGSPITALTDDNNGGVWVGSPVAGLRHVRRLPARRLDFSQGLPDRAVHHLAPDGHGGIWIGTARGLAHWRADGVRVYRPPALGLESEVILGLLLDRSGQLWIGQQDELIRVDELRRKRVVYRLAKAPSLSVTPMLQDRRGRIWFGTTEGDVGYLDPSQNGSAMRAQIRLLPDRVWSMIEDADGGIWVGQEGRVSRFVDTVAVEHLTEADGVPSGQIRGLAFDLDGSLWIASYGGGLAVWRPGQGVKRLAQGARLHDRMLSAIRIDREGRFWVFGDGGVNMFLRVELAAALAARRPARPAVDLGIGGGVPEGNGGHPNTWLDETSGWLWLATVNGTVAVNTLSASLGQAPISARIDEIVVDGLPRGVLDSLVVEPQARSVDIWFSSPWTSQVTSGRLRYRLTGHDPEWIEAGTARVARYANLSPGQYRFELATGYAGEAEPHIVRRLPMRVEPQWWETITARVGIAVLVLTGVWGVVLLSTRQLRRRNLALRQLLEEREEARRAASQAARDLAHVRRVSTAGELATSIAHELNQPLTAIMGTAQKARHVAAEIADGELVPALGVIVEQTERAAGVIRSLRSFVQKRAGKVEDLPVNDVVAETLSLVGHELHDRSVRVEVEEYSEKRAAVRGDSVQLQQVLINLLLNAADSMELIPNADRLVRVSFSGEPPSAIRISVADSGPGIPAAKLARIFEPFYSTKPAGLGLGLALSRSIVESHGGRLWAESPADGGAVFHLVLPLFNQ